MAEIIIKGISYPVTAKFQDEVLAAHPDLASKAYPDLAAEQKRILDLSTRRYNLDELLPPGEHTAPGGVLTMTEQYRLDCVTHVMNVHQAVKFLQGRSHSDFGFDGIDQVHGNRITLPCGCVKHHIFDHHKRHTPEELVFHDHPHPHDRKCRDHK
jgi:hypothetical protein